LYTGQITLHIFVFIQQNNLNQHIFNMEFYSEEKVTKGDYSINLPLPSPFIGNFYSKTSEQRKKGYTRTTKQLEELNITGGNW